MLERLARQRRPLAGLVVVDNDASAEVRSIVASAPGGPVDYLAAPGNLGPAGGIALGMEHLLQRAADDDWIVSVDDDDPPAHDGVLGDLLAFGDRLLDDGIPLGGVGLVGSRFDLDRGRTVRVPDAELQGPVAVDYIGGNQFPTYRARAVRAVGPFRSDLFFGLDDLEFGLRLKRSGFALYADGAGWLRGRAEGGRLGLDGQPAGALGPPTWRRYYSLRNLIAILRDHGRTQAALRVTVLHGLAKPLRNAPRAPGLALAHLRLNARACADGWRGRMGRSLEPVPKVLV
jgi:hypothetical protein